MSGELIERLDEVLKAQCLPSRAMSAELRDEITRLRAELSSLRGEGGMTEKCETCHGTGIHESPGYWDGAAECPECEGTGFPTPDSDVIGRLVGALQPFRIESDQPIFDEQGWTEFGLSWSKDRIHDWFGPSAFRRVHEALASIPTPDDKP